MEGTQSYTTRTDEVAANKPLVIYIGTELEITVEDYHLCGRCGTAMQLDHAGPFAYWFCPECGHETEIE